MFCCFRKCKHWVVCKILVAALLREVASADWAEVVGSFNLMRPYSLSRLCRQRLAAARSRHGSDSPPDCHSLPCRHFATPEEEPTLNKWTKLFKIKPHPHGIRQIAQNGSFALKDFSVRAFRNILLFYLIISLIYKMSNKTWKIDPIHI